MQSSDGPARQSVDGARNLYRFPGLLLHLRGEIEWQMYVLQPKSGHQHAQFLLQQRVQLARQAAVVGRELRDVDRLPGDLPVDGNNPDFGPERGLLLALAARPAGQIGADLVGRRLIAAVGLDQARRQVQFDLGFVGSGFALPTRAAANEKAKIEPSEFV